MGCRSVVAIYMNLPPNAWPDDPHPNQQTTCYLAGKDDKDGSNAYSRARCHPCPPSFDKFVMWCKQGFLGGQAPTTNSDGSLSNINQIWGEGGNFNYFVHDTNSGGFKGGSSMSCGPTTYPQWPQNNFPAMMCCKTCYK